MNSEKQGFSLFSKPIFEIIRDKGFLTPTPAQEKAFPIIKDNKNLLLIAPTGYGKTEAALLPIFDELLREKRSISLIMALRLSRLFGNSPDFWLHAQDARDLWESEQQYYKALERIQPLNAS